MLLVDHLSAMAGAFPDQPAFTQLDEGSMTFSTWDTASNRLARGLAEVGIGKGDRVSIYIGAEESLRWVVAYSAIHKAGGVAVPTNTRLARRELDFILGHAEARVVIAGREQLGEAQSLRSTLPSLETIIATETNSEGMEIGGDASDRIVPWSGAISDDASEFQVPVSEDDLADILYTSGTTGQPKGVAVRHRTLSMMPPSNPSWTGLAFLNASPLFTFAGIAFVYNPMLLGMRAVYMPRFDAGRWLQAVEEERPTFVFLVPSMAQLLIDHPRFDETDLSSIALCAIGSAPLPASTLRRLQGAMPEAAVSNSYGMTEAGPAFCSMPKGESLKRIGSVGIPSPPLEVRIVDEEENDVPPPEVGEVLMRMEDRQREYYRDPETTGRTWVGGWLHTGDLGHFDQDGYLYIVGRKKEMIIRGGNNIYPADVETVLLEHPAVADAVVVGVPHEILGEDVAAYVVAREGVAVGEEELRDFCVERLTSYKVPRKVRIVDELPRNAMGKVVKHRLPPIDAPGMPAPA